MKKCPYCQEDIQDIATKCRFCGEWLEQNTIEKQTDTATPNKDLRVSPVVDTTNNPPKVAFIARLFKGRLRRLDFFLYVVFAIVAVSIITSILLVSLSSIFVDSPGFYSFVIVVVYIFVGLLMVFGTVRRLHDMEMSGFWTLLCFVPIANLVMALLLLFKKGTDGVNKYGEKNEAGNMFKRFLGQV